MGSRSLEWRRRLRAAFAPAFVALACCAAAGCSARSPAYPPGYTQRRSAAGTFWVRTLPGGGRETYRVQTRPFTGSLKDLASSETIDTVLRNKGARYVSSDPFPGCPGEAGILTFHISGATGSEIREEAFTVFNQQSIVVTATRPATQPLEGAVRSAMGENVCNVPL